MKQQHIGDITVDKHVELEAPFIDPDHALPTSTLDEFETHRRWLDPSYVDYAQMKLIFSFHSYVVKTPHHNILVDTCVGNHKPRPLEHWNMLDTAYLENLRKNHIAPEEIDYVMCTHLHGDHVGWNTKLEDGRWVPTFPNAKYLFSEGDWDHYKDLKVGEHGYVSWNDSVLPIVEAGLSELVKSDYQLDDQVHLLPSPGHTPGHYCVHLQDQGQQAILTGDLIHHPVQVARPDWSSAFCNDPDQSRKTRIKFVDDYADTDVTILTAHFAGPTAGKIRGNGDAAIWDDGSGRAL
jgi:glyoxylase-like metal-dependent hydrolase (beta-lactamase superfamily II)